NYVGMTLNVTMHENYGMTIVPGSKSPLYEIVFKSGKLIESFDDGLLLETEREKTVVLIFIPYQSIKCVEIFQLQGGIN
ncbi:MAG TPA: hypothetical protein VK870_15515, partial [Ignavibacteriaceae bacterium]|nr:hypothetical protein [Ignavibacteriaceae bacterium]